jgi:hypothetical protein
MKISFEMRFIQMLYHCNSIVTYSWPFLALFSNIGDLRLMLSFNNDIVPLLFRIFSSFMMPAIIQYINAYINIIKEM